MKKSVIAACFACMLMAGTAALAAGPHAGLLDFASRYADSYVPEDARIKKKSTQETGKDRIT